MAGGESNVGQCGTIRNEGTMTVTTDESIGVVPFTSGFVDNRGTWTVAQLPGSGSEARRGIPFANSGELLADRFAGAVLSVRTDRRHVRLDGATLRITLQLRGGVLTGNGTITGSVNNTGGAVTPGPFTGALTIDGDYTQAAAGTMLVDLAGDAEFAHLIVTGTATLGGTMAVQQLDAYVPDAGTEFEFLSYGSRSGDFASVNGLDLGGGTTLVRNTEPARMTLVAENDSITGAEQTRTALNDGLAELRDQLAGWTALLALQDSQLPVVPGDLSSLFNLPQVVQQVATDRLLTANNSVATFTELRDVLETPIDQGGLGYVVECIAGDAGCPDGTLLQLRLTAESLGLSGSAEFNDATQALMDDLADAADLDGVIDWQSDLTIDLVMGVDATGFYLGGESKLALDVSGTGDASTSFTLAGALGMDAAGMAETTLVASLETADAAARFRASEFGNPTAIFAADVDGTGSVDLTFTVNPLDLPFTGTWTFDVLNNVVSTTAGVDFPNQNQLIDCAAGDDRRGLGSSTRRRPGQLV